MTSLDTLTLDQLIQLRRLLTTKLEGLEKGFKESISKDKQKLKDIESAAHAALLKTGGSKFSSEKGGTIYLSTIENFTVEDEQAFVVWMLQENEIPLPLKPLKDAMREYRDANDGVFPPGVVRKAFVKVNFRKPTKKVI